MIKLVFKIRGGNAPPALPVADPMTIYIYIYIYSPYIAIYIAY